MVDAFLIIVVVVAFFVLLIASLYLMIHYQHPDDHNDAWFPKLVVIFGFILACSTALLLPLDVANKEGYPGCDGYNTSICGGLDMELFWDIFFWLIPLWVFVLIPFSTFYYEADDGTLYDPTAPKKSRIWQALGNLFVVMLFMGTIFLVTYLLLSDSSIPIREYEGASIDDAVNTYDALFTTRISLNETSGEPLPFVTNQLIEIGTIDKDLLEQVTMASDLETIVLRVGPSTFYAGLMAFIGWFFFAIFGGIGMAAIPLDLYLSFRNRPHHLTPEEMEEAKQSITKRVNEMVEIGEQMKRERDEKLKTAEPNEGFRGFFSLESRRENRTDRNMMRDFKSQVHLLETDVADFVAHQTDSEKYNPIMPWLSLFMSIITGLLSFLWIVHICLYVLPPTPLIPFLNAYFSWFDTWFSLFGVLSVAIFTLYLLICAVKGCFKFGLRFVCITLHPMEAHKTYMSSFMFNIGLVLLCALPVVQFATISFADYAQFSTIRQIFGIQIENLQFFSLFWRNNIFVYVLLLMNVLTFCYLLCCTRDKHKDSKKLRDRLRANAHIDTPEDEDD